MDFRGKKYERGSNWSDPEVVELLQLWADESVQMELESCLRNQHVFNRIAEVLREKGIHRTGDQCREKIKKMKLEYRRIKDNNNKAARGGRTWKFYDAMDRVLTSRPSLAYSSLSSSMAQQVLQGTMVESYHHQFAASALPFGHSQHPELMEIKCEEVDSDERCLTPEPPPPMSYQQGSPDEHELERAFLDRAQNDSPISRVEIPIETSVSPSGFSEPNMASSSRIQSVGPRPGFSTLHRLRKKRKGQRVKDPLDDLLLKTLTSQRAMEERFLQMEERRLQRDLEVEERRMQLEQRRFELEREHEFRMFNVFAQMLSILKQSNGGSSSSVALPRGLDFGQALSDIAGFGGVDLQEVRAMHLGRPVSERRSNMYGFCNPGEFQKSPYLSARGNIANIFRGSTEEGYKAYHADKYDEDKNPNGIINFGTSENKLCFDLMSKRLTQSDMNLMEPPLLQYPDWKGHMFLREEVARFLTYYCKAPAPLKAENVIVLNGCGSLFSALATVLCDPGEAVLIATPFYGGVTQSVFLYGNVKLVYAYLDSKITGTNNRPFQLTVDKLEKALQDARAEGIAVKALILLNPQNPLGDIYSLSELRDYLDFAKRHELHVVVDEIYMLSVFDESATFHSVLGMDRLPDPLRTHVMWGISKDFAVSGIRFGTLYTENQDVANAVASLCYFHGVCGPVQHKIAQLLRDRDWINQVYLRANHARLKAAHTYVTDELKTLGVPFLNRNAGFFVWIDFRKYLRTGTFEEEMLLWRRFLDNKVLLSCGKAFECSEPGWFRIIFADKTHRLQLGMQRIRKVLEERECEILAEEKDQPCQSDQEGKADSTDEVIFVSRHQEPGCAGGSNLGDLIGLLQQQMRSSDWLQKNTAEQFAQEKPEIYDVFSKLVGK
ncbi:1-aminocyclopropane-1-carboxylate synthase-like protein 1 isoform X1 [Alligator mississippiensis]|uniref:Inactive 1-aminocyclopropane-1-carboxylate synthase-like protein 2 n=2 Tax=Alligator mississippiensis TaxID=8496 RepID=A0A151MBM3_ALLMI|nr:1-aminocyclopropane-1-carboxylate synthase-like protein 1 isoform X1 [Alligator mississippiensis]KYO21810.1 putative inactive 1-aminocyclopropane-1-carboxylate synthase-like protein 2 [Alligator mississippiensis]